MIHALYDVRRGYWYGLSYLTTGTNEIEKNVIAFLLLLLPYGVNPLDFRRRFAGASDEQAINSHKWSTHMKFYSRLIQFVDFFIGADLNLTRATDGSAYIKEVEIDRVGFRIVQTRNCAS